MWLLLEPRQRRMCIVLAARYPFPAQTALSELAPRLVLNFAFRGWPAWHEVGLTGIEVGPPIDRLLLTNRGLFVVSFCRDVDRLGHVIRHNQRSANALARRLQLGGADVVNVVVLTVPPGDAPLPHQVQRGGWSLLAFLRRGPSARSRSAVRALAARVDKEVRCLRPAAPISTPAA